MRLPDPGRVRAFGDEVADGNVGLARREIEAVARRFDLLSTPLPEAPDVATPPSWLRWVRQAHLPPG